MSVSATLNKVKRIRTVDFVVDKTFARVELASGLPTNQELIVVSYNWPKGKTEKALTTSSPSTTLPPPILETTPNGSSLGSRFEFRRAMYRSSPTDGSMDSQYNAH